MPALLLFRDRDPWFKPLGKYNKTGYVTGRNTVIYPRFTRIVERPIAKIRDNNKKLIDISRHQKAFLIEMFYANNQITPFLFGMALAHLEENNSQFWDSPIKLPKLNPNPPTEFEERWNCFTKILLPAD